jgi:uncharacterized lipoprotein YajG
MTVSPISGDKTDNKNQTKTYMKKILILVAAVAIASLTGCATSPSQNSAAYTMPKAYQYNASTPAPLTTSNPGSLYDPTSSENNAL